MPPWEKYNRPQQTAAAPPPAPSRGSPWARYTGAGTASRAGTNPSPADIQGEGAPRPAFVPPAQGSYDPALEQLVRDTPGLRLDLTNLNADPVAPTGAAADLAARVDDRVRVGQGVREMYREQGGRLGLADLREMQAFAQTTPEQRDQQQAEQRAAAFREARPNIPGVRSAVSGFQQSVLTSGSLLERVTQNQQQADELNRVSGLATAGGNMVEQGIEGAARSLTDMFSTAVGGPAAVIGGFVAKATNEAVTEGRDAGLEGPELASFALGQGAIEGIITTAFQKLGLGGLESAFKQPAKQGLRQGLRQAGVATLAELPEEITIELAGAVQRKLQNVDPEALTAENLTNLIAQTTITTLITMGAASTPGVVASARQGATPGTQPAATGRTVTDEAPTQIVDRNFIEEAEAALYGREDAAIIQEAQDAGIITPRSAAREVGAPADARARQPLDPNREAAMEDADLLSEAEAAGIVTPESAAVEAGIVTPDSATRTPAEQPAYQQPQQEMTFEELVEFAGRQEMGPDAPAEAVEAGKGFYREEFGKVEHADTGFVQVNVPLSMLDAADRSGARGYRVGDAERYSQMDPATAPPGVAGTVPGDSQLLVFDGNTRVAAARLRGESTVRMLIPRGTAEEKGLIQPQGPKLPATLQEAVEAVREHKGIRPAARATGIAESTLRGRLKRAKVTEDELVLTAAEAEGIITPESAEAERGLPARAPNANEIREAQASRAARTKLSRSMRKRAEAPEANQEIQDIAAQYSAALGKEPPQHNPIEKMNPIVSRKVAREYASMEHQPNDPIVQASYNALMDETLDQFRYLQQQGYTFEAWTQPGQPYENAAEMAQDIAENRRLYYFPSDSGFGDAETDRSDHPMLAEAPDTGGLRYNDVFRIVHDFFGHAKDGYGFDLVGEENAWRSHSTMYSKEAQNALATETRGQSNWVGYGPKGAANRAAIAEGRIGDVVFADQKAGLMASYRPDPADIEMKNLVRGQEDALTDATKTRYEERYDRMEKAGGVFNGNDPDTLLQAAVPAIKNMAGGLGGIQDVVSKVGTPTGSVIRKWAPRLYGRLKQMQAAYRRDRHDADFQVQKMEKLLKAEYDRDQQDHILYNLQVGNHQRARELIHTGTDNYAAVEEQLDLVLKLKNQWREQGVEAGLKIGEVQNHFPRQVRPAKYAAWTEILTGEERIELDRLIAQFQAREGRNATDMEKAEIANKWLAGYARDLAGRTSPRNLSRRSVENLTFPEWKEFYQQGFQPAYSYFDRLIYNTHKARLFGKNMAEATMDETIGQMFVEGKYGISDLNAYQQNRLKSAIKSIFTGGEQSPARTIQALRNLGYMGTLLDPSAAAIQFGDLALVAARDGILPTLSSIPRAMRERVLTASNVGLDHLSEEYGNSGKLSSALRKGFKAVGFHLVDTKALNVSMVSAVREAQRASKKRVIPQRWIQQWRPVFGEDFDALVRDLQSGNITELVQDYAFMAASEIRPVDALDMPEYYNQFPNARIFYMLKGFAMKQFDFLRQQGYNKIARGVRTDNPRLAAEGLGGLVRAMLMLALAGGTVDWIRDWMLGRNPDFSRSMVDGLLYTHFGSLYLLQSVGDDGPGSAAAEFITPPIFNMMDTLWRDLAKGTYKSAQHLPFGRTLYSFTPESEARYREYARRDVLDKAVQAWMDGDHAAASAYVRAFNTAMQENNQPERLSMSSVRRSAKARERSQ